MKPSTELFKLIKSLSKSEKRFFKLSSALQSGDKNYLKIFDVIEKQEEYDEEELKKSFKKEKFIKHLPSEKNHLYKLILKSLRSYHSDQTTGGLLKQELKNVEILYDKALFKECEKFVKRAKELAREYERFYYLFELISWEKKLLEEAYQSGEFGTDLDELVAEEEEVISKLRNLAEYTILYSKINLIFRTGGFTRNEKERKLVEEIADYHLIKGKNTALSTTAASICYYIKGLCAATNRVYSDSFQFFNRTKEILNNNPKIKEESSQRYLLTLGHLIRCYIDSRDFENASKVLEELQDLAQAKGFVSIDINLKIFTLSKNLQLNLLHAKGEFEKSVDLTHTIEKTLEELGDKISKEQLLLFKYNFAYANFGAGEYKKALQYINDVLNDNEQNLRQDIYSFARILNLLIHFELGNFEFMDYVIKSTNRYLNKQEKDYDIENIFVKYIRKVSKMGNSLEGIPIFEEMQVEIKKLLSDHNEQVILEYIDVLAWIESHVNNKSFANAVKESVKIIA